MVFGCTARLTTFLTALRPACGTSQYLDTAKLALFEMTAPAEQPVSNGTINKVIIRNTNHLGK
jgi:hypothetical protein